MVYSSLTSLLPGDGIRSQRGRVVEVISTVILLLLLILCHRYSTSGTSMVYSRLTSLLPGDGIRSLTGRVVEVINTVILLLLLLILCHCYSHIQNQYGVLQSDFVTPW